MKKILSHLVAKFKKKKIDPKTNGDIKEVVKEIGEEDDGKNE
jgi:hypothetical protein